MKKLLHCLLYLGLIPALYGQHSNPQQLAVNISYFGETAIHPGIKTGLSYTFWEKEKHHKRFFKGRQNRLGPKAKKYQFWAGANLAFYNHPNNHSGLLPNLELGWRRIKMRQGTTFGAQIGLGYLRRFYNIPTYALGVNGALDNVSAAGRGMFTPSVAVLWGKDLSVKGKLPLSWHIKPTFLLLAPYNHTSVVDFALELGVSYHLKRNQN